MANVNPQQVQKNKASGKGCLIALGVFGAFLAVSVIIGGIVVYKIMSSPEGRKIVAAVGETTKLTQEAMKAPGTAELRKLGCDQAMVIDAERMMSIVESFVPDSGGKPDLSEKLMVMCQMGMLGKSPPTCDDVAKTYAAAVPSGTSNFLVQVTAQGDNKPHCQARYSPSGDLLSTVK